MIDLGLLRTSLSSPYILSEKRKNKRVEERAPAAWADEPWPLIETPSNTQNVVCLFFKCMDFFSMSAPLVGQ